jgi:hypothetical protein
LAVVDVAIGLEAGSVADAGGGDTKALPSVGWRTWESSLAWTFVTSRAARSNAA